MRHVLGTVLVFVVLLFGGCTKDKRPLELTPNNISTVWRLKLDKASVLRHVVGNGRAYGYYYHLDASKGSAILQYIRDANVMTPDRNRIRQKAGEPLSPVCIYFETRDAVYCAHIGWDERCVYGYWWASPDLFRVFRGWGFFEELAKADPNWPPPIWNRVSAQFDPNLAMFRAPWGDYPLMRDQFALRLETKTELTRETFLQLDISAPTDIRIVWPQHQQDREPRLSSWMDANTVLGHIRDARQIKFDTARTGKILYFVVDKTLYRTGIDWDDEKVYGDWWESPELLSIFRGWGLFEELAKADPNCMAPSRYKNPPPEAGPNFPRCPAAKLGANE